MSRLLPSFMSSGQHAADCIGLLMHCDGDAHMRPKQVWGSTMP